MTNQEAIALLRNLEDSLDSYCELNEKGKTAFRMAIEALNSSEFPNSSDCIDRAEAQTAIQFAARRYTVAHEAHGEGHVVWSDNLISVTDAMNALREVPSAQPERQKGHWIFDFARNEMTCSECGRTFTGGFDLENADNFCRHCGSDMR